MAERGSPATKIIFCSIRAVTLCLSSTHSSIYMKISGICNLTKKALSGTLGLSNGTFMAPLLNYLDITFIEIFSNGITAPIL